MSESTPSPKDVFLRTLIASGFVLEKVEQKPDHTVVIGWGTDRFGVPQRHLFAFSGEHRLSRAAVKTVSQAAIRHGATPIIVGGVVPGADTSAAGAPAAGGAPLERYVRGAVTVITPDAFLARMGGGIASYLPLETEYPQHVAQLGHNQVPPGLSGRADDLFEAYVAEGLAFLLRARVVRYGQERAFEALPDGVVFTPGGMNLLYDAKAYKDGYKVERTSIRQFADYIRQFRERYARTMEGPYAFLVISGTFPAPQTLAGRSREMYAECQVPLVFLDAGTLGRLATLFVERPAYRQCVDWRSHLAGPLVDAQAVADEVAARERDGVLPIPIRVPLEAMGTTRRDRNA